MYRIFNSTKLLYAVGKSMEKKEIDYTERANKAKITRAKNKKNKIKYLYYLVIIVLVALVLTNVVAVIRNFK